tara:strand:- start:4089 stop:4355 length:267 start_codon:yes stop_codon:yes gene_type:complete
MTKKELKITIEAQSNWISYLRRNKKELKIRNKELDIKLARAVNINEKLSNMYESQLKVQDSEMRRLNIIINNYEVKLNITVKKDSKDV